ncbi:LytR/AlgR family response regulator transcription factor [Lewinella cohaerens]|uniref:LytR/AlgR family response regulator transcription factor n=1 Tax=Lewinella cohaerens TaxID=70995 RepID=UPI00036F243C|nr:LytTR family DNA-binding domain-containing protein [Lewinella cohaerens]
MNILIIEDEHRIARRIERMLRSIMGKEITSIQHCDALEDGQGFIAHHKVDLLFLDLNLNGEDGFGVLESVVAEPFPTIIISAYRDQAIRAFEYGVLDFVPKPFSEERLAQAVQRLQKREKQANTLRYLAIQKKGRRTLIPIADIYYIQGAGVYTELHLKDGTTAIHNKTLENLELLLPEHFVRIHKSYLVSMQEAREIVIEPGSKYSLRLNNEEQLPIGRTRYKEIKKRWFG